MKQVDVQLFGFVTSCAKLAQHAFFFAAWVRHEFSLSAACVDPHKQNATAYFSLAHFQRWLLLKGRYSMQKW